MKPSNSEVIHRWMIPVEQSFWLGIIIRNIVAGQEPWICAYAQLPWVLQADLSTRELFTERLNLTYMGPGQAFWNLEKGHTPETWIGVDWYQRSAPPIESVENLLKVTCEQLIAIPVVRAQDNGVLSRGQGRCRG